MRHILIVFVFLASGVLTAAPASSLVGHWEGAVSRHGSVQLLSVDLRMIGDSLAGIYAIPEISLYDEPLSEVSLSDSILTLRILYGPFPLYVHGDIDQLTGSNTDWGPPVSMHLKKTPYTPESFFTKREVRFTSRGTQLVGTLCLPVGTGPFPAVVLVHGSGEQGRFLWYYRSHGYGLLRAGIAVFMYDKRGCGESAGETATADLATLSDDALAALDACTKDPSIDRRLSGLFGISQGGWICAVAYQRLQNAPFLVLNEAPAVSTFQQDLHRIEYSMRAEEYAQPAIDSALNYASLYFDAVLHKRAWPKLKKAVADLSEVKWKDFVTFPATYNDSDMVWWRAWNYNPAADLARITCPTLCLFGEIDPNVPPDRNIQLMDSLLSRGGSPHEIHIIPNLPHAAATYQTLKGRKWDWPAAFWVWSFRPPEIDNTSIRFIKSLKGY